MSCFDPPELYKSLNFVNSAPNLGNYKTTYIISYYVFLDFARCFWTNVDESAKKFNSSKIIRKNYINGKIKLPVWDK